ncbi:MAG: S8 family serine peptidase [Saprospiraceae bacterium]
MTRNTFSDSAQQVSNFLNIWLLRSNLPEQELLAWLRQQPEVHTAQFNHYLENRAIPNDPLFPQQWHLLNDSSSGGVFNADLDAEKAWDITTGGLSPAGDTIVIAVIDGGVDVAHPDLKPNLWRNWAELPNNGQDDDFNGYIDDFNGWNVFTQSDEIQGNATGHGTPVSAILGAKGDNGIGVTGVNWNTKIMFVAAIGLESSILAAFDYIYQARERYNSSWGEKGSFVVTVNCSWGINYGQPSQSPSWCEAFDKLGDVGIVSVAATANIPVNVDEVGDLPTACPSNFLISVTSLNKFDEKAPNAAWGEINVDLGAYGQEVFSAAPSNGFGYFSGTSFAAPQVAGAVALLYAAPCPNLIALAKTEPDVAAFWVKSMILENVSPNISLKEKTLTDGRLNLFRALHNYESQCSDCPAPFALKTEEVSDSSAFLVWTPPNTGLHTNLRWRMLGMGEWHTVWSVTAPYFLGGISTCSYYEFETQSICEGGVLSPWSQPFIFKTMGCCAAPNLVWLEESGADFAQIAWESSSFNNGYRLRIRQVGIGDWDYFEPDDNFWEFQNLDPCTPYEAQVQVRCGSLLTDFSAVFLFQTKGCGPCNEISYCFAKAGDATEEWIASVQIDNWSHESGQGGPGYQNFSLGPFSIPKLVSETPALVVITPGHLGLLTKEHFRVYVDFNQDGDFDEPNELAFDPGFALEGPASGFIQVPPLTETGITRLRVMMKYTGPNDPPPSACSDFAFGQVEDYCVLLRIDTLNSSIPEEDSLSLLQAYPQPAHDWVMLDLPEWASNHHCELKVLDITGRIITFQNNPLLRNGMVLLDTHHWASGFYAVQVRCGGIQLRGKLMKL